MHKYAVINLKTDPELKKKAVEAADKLGISISAVLNNELRRFAAQQSVIFEVPEMPNKETAKALTASKAEIESGELYRFSTNEQALDFLTDELG